MSLKGLVKVISDNLIKQQKVFLSNFLNSAFIIDFFSVLQLPERPDHSNDPQVQEDREHPQCAAE